MIYRRTFSHAPRAQAINVRDNVEFNFLGQNMLNSIPGLSLTNIVFFFSIFSVFFIRQHGARNHTFISTFVVSFTLLKYDMGCILSTQSLRRTGVCHPTDQISFVTSLPVFPPSNNWSHVFGTSSNLVSTTCSPSLISNLPSSSALTSAARDSANLSAWLRTMKP